MTASDSLDSQYNIVSSVSIQVCAAIVITRGCWVLTIISYSISAYYIQPIYSECKFQAALSIRVCVCIQPLFLFVGVEFTIAFY